MEDNISQHRLGTNNGDLIVPNAPSGNLHHPSNKKCWIPTLKAKRCLAFVHCPRQALSFYGTPSDDIDGVDTIVEKIDGSILVNGGDVTSSGTVRDPIKDKGRGIQKGMCASFDEAYCFGNPQLMKIDAGGSVSKDETTTIRRQQHQKDVFEHHQKSIRRVGNNKQKWRECQDVKRVLEQCLRNVTPPT